ncbi:MAG: CDP-diacylglycerol--glycerol-3-phosphate 3-phosphatidyltransferase [Clostridia bacterium]|nr:CDP-diacylglycerol--glycerol-3-phosphate 3-phosphatidyltransferase [Clostridia bacterium]
MKFLKKINLPTKFTLLRMILVPVLLVFMVIEELFGSDSVPRIISAAVFAICALTDFLDGYIARKKDMVTDLGKFLDPIADKLLILCTMMAFCASPVYEYLHLWAFIAGVLVLMRELIVTSLRLLMAGKNTVIAASWHGKCKTVSQTVFVLVAILEPVIHDPEYVLTYVALAVMAVMTVFSGILYLEQYLPVIMEDQKK